MTPTESHPRNLLAYLGGGSRKIGLFVLLALIGGVGVFLHRMSWAEYVGSLTALSVAVSIAIGLEDAAEKRGRGSDAAPKAIAIVGDTQNVATASEEKGGAEDARS
jgi:hypothetical protein